MASNQGENWAASKIQAANYLTNGSIFEKNKIKLLNILCVQI